MDYKKLKKLADKLNRNTKSLKKGGKCIKCGTSERIVCKCEVGNFNLNIRD